MEKSFSKQAFTLAETLIVIGIIGVVAALTLPNLNHATGDKERVTRVKKIYSSLTDAFERAQAVYGDFDTWHVGLEDSNNSKAADKRVAQRITEFMKVSKDCGLKSGCCSKEKFKSIFGNSVSTIGLDIGYFSGSYGYRVLLSDNTSLYFATPAYSSFGFIIADIDGPKKGKSKFGEDLFVFQLKRRNNTLDPCPEYSAGEDLTTKLFREENANIEDTAINMNGPIAATCWIITYDNADYLKTNYEGKCNDSDIVLDGVNNTSCH